MSEELMAVLAAVLGVVIGAGVVGLMARGRLQTAAQRVQHLEQQRLQAAQQTSAARRQIETLQKEVGELRHLMTRRGVALPDRENPGLEATPEVEAPSKGPEAFAATQLIQRGGEG